MIQSNLVSPLEIGGSHTWTVWVLVWVLENWKRIGFTLNYFLHRIRIAPGCKSSSRDRLQLVLFYFYHTVWRILKLVPSISKAGFSPKLPVVQLLLPPTQKNKYLIIRDISEGTKNWWNKEKRRLHSHRKFGFLPKWNTVKWYNSCIYHHCNVILNY